MTPEISQEYVVVSGEVAYGIVLFSGCVDYGGGMMCEAGEVGTVLLGEESLHGFAFFCIVEKEGIGACGGEEEFSLVVEVEGGYVGVGRG